MCVFLTVFKAPLSVVYIKKALSIFTALNLSQSPPVLLWTCLWMMLMTPVSPLSGGHQRPSETLAWMDTPSSTARMEVSLHMCVACM